MFDPSLNYKQCFHQGVVEAVPEPARNVSDFAFQEEKPKAVVFFCCVACGFVTDSYGPKYQL
jgi:hypothetical protein